MQSDTSSSQCTTERSLEVSRVALAWRRQGSLLPHVPLAFLLTTASEGNKTSLSEPTTVKANECPKARLTCENADRGGWPPVGSNSRPSIPVRTLRRPLCARPDQPPRAGNQAGAAATPTRDWPVDVERITTCRTKIIRAPHVPQAPVNQGQPEAATVACRSAPPRHLTPNKQALTCADAGQG